MSKAKQNSFLVGYLSVLTLGTVALGFLAWSSYAASSEAQETYDATKSKLQSLQKGAIFPKLENVDAKKKQVDGFVEKVKALDGELRTFQKPLETELTSLSFQSKLQKARDGLIAEAKDAGTKLPDNFDLGMGAYLSAYPEPTAVPRLNAWLDGMQFFISKLIASGVKEVNLVSRPELAFEKNVEAKAEEAPKGKAKPAPSKPASKTKAEAVPVAAAIGENEVLERYPFTVVFTASSRALNEVMTFTANPSPKGDSPFFYNIRVLRLENEQKTGADTQVVFNPQEETDPVTQKPFKRDSIYIFGQDKVQVHLSLDLIRFPETEVAAASK